MTLPVQKSVYRAERGARADAFRAELDKQLDAKATAGAARREAEITRDNAFIDSVHHQCVRAARAWPGCAVVGGPNGGVPWPYRLSVERAERFSRKMKGQADLQDSWKKLSSLSPAKKRPTGDTSGPAV